MTSMASMKAEPMSPVPDAEINMAQENYMLAMARRAAAASKVDQLVLIVNKLVEQRESALVTLRAADRALEAARAALDAVIIRRVHTDPALVATADLVTDSERTEP